jgi:CheY-like chemotaxis protein
MDCHMPVMDGFDATIEIRGLPGEASRVPIIAMTAGVQDDDRRRCIDAGMDGFIAKPVEFSALEEALTRWVHHDSHPDPDEPALDPARLDVLRNLGPGLFPEAAHAFKSEVRASLVALDHAISQSDNQALKYAAHKLKGGASNIGAARAAALCARLEQLALAGGDPPSRELIDRLETELAKVDAALDRALDGAQ